MWIGIPKTAELKMLRKPVLLYASQFLLYMGKCRVHYPASTVPRQEVCSVPSNNQHDPAAGKNRPPTCSNVKNKRLSAGESERTLPVAAEDV